MYSFYIFLIRGDTMLDAIEIGSCREFDINEI